MSRTVTPHARPRELTRLPWLFRRDRGRCVTALLLLVTFNSLPAAFVHAESPAAPPGAVYAIGSPVAPGFRGDRQYVYSMGILIRVTDDAITIRFEDGQTTTYDVDDVTTIHTPNGHLESVGDLDVGNMVIVITEEHKTKAVVIVNSGNRAFSEGGPYDIGEHE
jgi:hypothetical protein